MTLFEYLKARWLLYVHAKQMKPRLQPYLVLSTEEVAAPRQTWELYSQKIGSLIHYLKGYPMKTRPATAADIDAKFERFAEAQSDPKQITYILWWQPQTDDPALASLGGGILTMSSCFNGAILNEQGVKICDPMDNAKYVTIERADIIDLRFASIHDDPNTVLRELLRPADREEIDGAARSAG